MSKPSSNENIEEKVRNLAVELRTLENFAGDIQTRLGVVETMIRDINLAMATVQGLENIDKNDEILMNVGGGSYIKVKIVDKEKVILRVGAGVNLEKPAKEALTLMENELNNILKTRATFQQQFNQIIERMTAVRRELEKISRSVET